MKSNKFVLGALTLAVMTPAIVIPMTQYGEVTPVFASEKVAFSKVFSDVSKNSDYYETIHQMAEKGIINGYEDGTFVFCKERIHSIAIANTQSCNLTWSLCGHEYQAKKPAISRAGFALERLSCPPLHVKSQRQV